jgi:hypothetical protein
MQQVEICVKGHIDTTWSEWLNGMTIIHTVEDESVLAGEVVDQFALYGLLNKLRDMGLALVSVPSEDVVGEVKQRSRQGAKVQILTALCWPA